jgi:hypothetical protein
MNTAGKVVIGLFVVAAVGGVVMLSSSKTASAAPGPTPRPLPPPGPPSAGPPLSPAGQPQDHEPETGGIIVPPPPSAPPGTPAVVIPPPPGGVPTAAPGGGITIPTPGGPVTIPQSSLPQVTQTPGGGSVLTLPGGGTVPIPSGVLPPSSVPSLPGTPPINVPPVVVTAGAPTAAGDTIAVAQAMLEAEGNNTTWRSASVPGLAEWQRTRGLTPDGKAGTGTMLRMAQEIGAIPIVRAWPTGSYPTGHWLPDYKASLMQIAQTKTGAHRDLLEQSAARENGQGFGTPPKPILSALTLEG